MNELDEPLKVLLGRGAGDIAKHLHLTTVGELLRHLPRRYLERGELTDIESLTIGEYVTFVGRVNKVDQRWMKQRKGTITDVEITDGRSHIDAAFFNQHRNSRFAKHMKPGAHMVFAGTVSAYRGRLQLAQPQWDPFEEEVLGNGRRPGRVTDIDDLQSLAASVPAVSASPYVRIYPATAKLKSRQISDAITTVLSTLRELPDVLPEQVRARHGLPDLLQAFRMAHHPQQPDDPERAAHRFAFEEAFVLQTELARRRRVLAQLGATPRVRQPAGLLAEFDARLPFTLTDGQVQISEQIFAELARPHPMHRLLQGEVGSGKTVVALRAMLAVVDAGGQAALLAPTEVLAAQHARTIADLLGPMGLAGQLDAADTATGVTLLTGSMSAPARRAALLDIASGQAGIVVGTHALLQDRVQFADLGLVVVDEQHRFGVEQRAALTAKASPADGDPNTAAADAAGQIAPGPHVLVMTATPIPRTIAMTVFGDLEVSTLRELPAGRAEVQTTVVPVAEKPTWLERAWARIDEEVAAGRQAYVVCPRIGGDEPDEPDDSGAGGEDEEGKRRPVALHDLLPRLQAEPVLRQCRIASLHGRMPADQKDAVMRSFAAGDADVLVATTVIEVGVDVPNASVMVVMDADRFGVSQLHQLRGRVGRGEYPGLCLLVSEASDDSPAAQRLAALAANSDGFAVSEIDLDFRREGDVLGARQAGTRNSLTYLSVLRDVELILAARAEAEQVLDADPDLAGQPLLARACAELEDSTGADYLGKG